MSQTPRSVSDRLTALARRASRAPEKLLNRDSWIIGIRRGDEHSVDYYRNADSRGFVCLPAPAEGFLADPFLVEHEGKDYIFCEEFLRSVGRGVIAYVEVQEGLRFSQPRMVLERPHHLSYPFVFRIDDCFFMIPESATRHSIDLYRSTKFPDKWKLDCCLLSGISGNDSTMVKYNDKWWLFTCLSDSSRMNATYLNVYWADSFRGPWIEHPQNPVVSDLRVARPAGRFLHIGETLIRPSQDCSRRYGGSLKFNLITTLSETEYHEETIGVVDGSWNRLAVGAHTWNQGSKYEVIDGPCLESRWFPRREG